MKITQTNILTRKILLSFIVFVVLLVITALVVRNNITRKLEKISDLAQTYDSKVNPESALLLLRQAEDDFQSSLLEADSQKSLDYKTKLTQAFNRIDTLLKENADTSQLSVAQRSQVNLWHQKKIQLSDRLFRLKHSFDSLLTVYAEYNRKTDRKPKPVTVTHTQASKDVVKQTDTVKKVIPADKKKLFGRIKDAIANKPNPTTGVIEINHNNQTNVKGVVTQSVRDEKADVQKLQQLQQSYGQLMDMQRRLILLNSNITNELERILNEVRDINYQMTDALKDMTFKNYEETAGLLNKFYLAALFLILLFALLLIYFIVQLNSSELLLRKENERSITTARQKMDLLLHMSHEIRNPLTAIKGFLFIFSKTNLNERQMEMLKSIRGSSDMLLRTLNDTLDAAKMENSELKIDALPFNPEFSIHQVVDNMSYSAEKKQLSLSYDFVGNKEALVVGDEFRLKQVLVNLISNAIKYTPKGGIKIHAELQNGDGLQVDITDTGAGISAEQLPNLFSKYYQTSSSKGQIGTGLGLFICKQLVEMQGGKISVKSDPSKGTTFSFFIPYRKHEPDGDVQTADPLSVLNGLSILAVDDNELNLMFLKIMTAKWNVKFHQASSGKEALEILSTISVNIVLTDIQMPEMDGKQLLKAIGALPSPINKVPVIAISGLSEKSNGDGLDKIGFSGFVSKPFVEQELADELIKVLSKPA